MPAAGSLVDQVANFAVTFVPLVLIAVAVWQSWGGLLAWQDIFIFFATLIPFGFGITVGFHRLFTHRAFKTTKTMRLRLGGAGLDGAGGAGDRVGRLPPPPSPVLRRGGRSAQPPLRPRPRLHRGALRGLFHAHVGWVLFSDEPAEEERYAPDLMADPVVRFVDRTFVLWAVLGLAMPFGLGVPAHRHPGRRPARAALGRRGADLRPPPHHLLRQLPLPLLRPPRLRDRRRVPQRRLARALHLRRGLAQQPPRLPDLRPPRPRPGRARPLGGADHADGETGLAWDVVRVTPERMASKAV